MIHSRNDTLLYARSYESPKHNESELRKYLIENGADYYDASSIARESMLYIENGDWNDGRYFDD
jgi:hypothetical protein